MTGESLYPRDLIERLRAELDRLEELARPAALHIDEHGWHDGGGMCSEEWDFIDANGPHVVLRTIQAHRKILALHCRVDSRPDWFGTWEQPACYGCAANFDEEYAVPDIKDCPIVAALASIYFPESDG